MNEVEAAAKAHCDYFGGEGWWDTGLIADTKPKALDAMLAAIAALDAARGDRVARVVEWLRNGGGTDISQLNGSMQMLFLKGMNRYADAIERGEPFNG
jgi:hypothetical protein